MGERIFFQWMEGEPFGHLLWEWNLLGLFSGKEMSTDIM